jgi:CubicO group peptidase (beta-lactamase class C family)
MLPAGAIAAERAPMTLAEVKAAIDAGALAGVHGVVVRHRGATLAEWYFSGQDQTIGQDFGRVDFGPETLHDVRSVTKSVVSLLFGIASGDGVIDGIDGAIVDRFPEYTDLPAATTADVKLGHVLSMTSGWQWDEFTYPYTDPRNSEIAMELSDDPLRYVLTQARVSAPGERFMYSGGDVALIGAVIARAVGMPLDRYAETKLFAPLGIERSGWSKRGDVPRAASGLRLTPRAMAAIGELVLARGQWRGRQIVPAAWIDAATRPQIAIPGDRAPGAAYGYFWWLGETAGEPWIGATGNGGQRIWIVPSRELVVVTTMGLYDSPDQGRVPLAILEAAIAATRT